MAAGVRANRMLHHVQTGGRNTCRQVETSSLTDNLLTMVKMSQKTTSSLIQRYEMKGRFSHGAKSEFGHGLTS